MNGLTRDPADWARDWGWVSRVRAKRAATRLLNVAEGIENALGTDDEGAQYWVGELRSIAKYIAPAQTPAEQKRARRETAAV